MENMLPSFSLDLKANKWKTSTKSSWWFQPIWKNVSQIRLDHFPKWGQKILKNETTTVVNSIQINLHMLERTRTFQRFISTGQERASHAIEPLTFHGDMTESQAESPHANWYPI